MLNLALVESLEVRKLGGWDNERSKPPLYSRHKLQQHRPSDGKHYLQKDCLGFSNCLYKIVEISDIIYLLRLITATVRSCRYRVILQLEDLSMICNTALQSRPR